jgi:hypothetical protein
MMGWPEKYATIFRKRVLTDHKEIAVTDWRASSSCGKRTLFAGRH